jgi:hypothetical protein
LVFSPPKGRMLGACENRVLVGVPTHRIRKEVAEIVWAAVRFREASVGAARE